MSYHLGSFSQADWFYGGKPPADAPTPTGAGTPEPATTSAPTPAPTPAQVTAAPTTIPSSSAPASYEGGSGLSIYMIAGVTALVLAGILIYFKFSASSDEEVYEEVAEAVVEPVPEPKPEKKGKKIVVEIQTDDE